MPKITVEIYGRDYCPYCRRAKATFEALEAKGLAQGTYTDMDQANVSKEDLSAKAGVEVRTIPQVWVNGKHIGGCDDFHAWLAANNLPA